MSDPLSELKINSDIYEIVDDYARTYKQDTLVSGTNIKTINGSSVLGSGNLVIPTNIPLGSLDGTSTATAMTATVSGITALTDGACMFLKNGVITSASGVTLNINGLGAKPIYQSQANASAITTQFQSTYTAFMIYDSTRVAGGCWMYVYGYDSNSNTIGYQLRTSSSTKPASDTGYRYRLWFTSADGTKYVPANKSTSTNATASRTPNTTPIDPWGHIAYNATNGSTTAGSNLPTATMWFQYTLSLGYSFNTTGVALTMSYPDPVYVKCSPQNDGSATLQGYTQALPTTADGYIYIFLGVAYSATNIELYPYHPVYYYSDGAIRIWTNSASGGGSVSPSSTMPIMDGTADVGTETAYARGDHVHPSDTTKQDKVTATTATLTSGGWSSHTQTVSVTGVTATNTVIVTYAPSDKTAWEDADIYCSAQGSGTLTFACTTDPSANVTANVLIIP